MTALLGPNGAGKTTVLRAICGAVSTTGTVVFDGVPITSRKPSKVARLGVAHVPEGRGTFGEFSVLDNLRLGGYSRDESTRTSSARSTVFPHCASAPVRWPAA